VALITLVKSDSTSPTRRAPRSGLGQGEREFLRGGAGG
jgi:hypothetical protein